MDCLKINFCAAPSSRKTTVCSALESMLKQKGINADLSKEYARQFIGNYGLPSDLHDQYVIYDNQNTRDNASAKVSEIMISDTPSCANYVFAVRLLRGIMKERGQDLPTPSQYKFLEEMYMKSFKKSHWFDLTIVFPPLDPVVMDGTRIESEADKHEIYNALIGFLNMNLIPYIVVEGDSQEKIQKCFDLIMDLYNGRTAESTISA